MQKKKNEINKSYYDLLNKILEEGYEYEDPNRRGTIRREIQEYTIRHEFSNGFPILTTKKVAWKSIIGELLWILRGDTNIKFLVDNNIPIWNKDAYNWFLKERHRSMKSVLPYTSFIERIKESKAPKNIGHTGKSYGYQLRNWEGKFDQLKWLIEEMKTNPMKTKKTITMWNPREADECALTPCHWGFEILVKPLSFWERVDLIYCKNAISTSGNLTLVREELDQLNCPNYSFMLKWHQHSVDVFLGLPFNIAFYGMLAQILGKLTNMVPTGIIGDLSNVHIYKQHLPQVQQQIERDIDKYQAPKIEFLQKDLDLLNTGDIDNFLNNTSIDSLRKSLIGYKSYPRISAEMISYT